MRCSLFVPLFLFGTFLFVSCEGLGLDKPETDEPLEAVPLTLTKAQEAYVTNGNAFAVKLLAEMEKVSEKPGYFFSPMSVSMSLTMLLNGTQGEARAELAAALGYGESFDPDLVNDYCRQFIERAPTWDPKVSLSVANALVANQNYTIKVPFKATLQKNFSAEVSSRDFTKAETLNFINDWCKKQTRGMIPKVLENINPMAILYLINAIYFKGTWKSSFDPSDTKKDTFYLADGSKKTVDMMHQKVMASLRGNETTWMLELPYGNASFSMQIVLPQADRMKEVISEIEASGWNSFFPAIRETTVDVFLPKFEQEYKYNLFDPLLPLRAAGIHKILDGSADFTSICDASPVISDIIHKTAIKIDESGSEAAAVTVITMDGATPGGGTVTSIPVFRADHPFLYAIVEKTTGAILFLGKYGGD